MTFKPGDFVTFAPGITAGRIATEVGGSIAVWHETLTAGDFVTSVSSGGESITLRNSGMWCKPRFLQLMDPEALEPDAVWSARWTKMMEE